MDVLILLLIAGIAVATIFLFAFLWGVKRKQFDDDYSPPLRSHKIVKLILLPVAALLINSAPVFAEGPKAPSAMSNPFVVLVVIIIFFLALVIFSMSRLVTGAAGPYLQKQKKESEEQKKNIKPQAAAILIFLLCSIQLFAQDNTATAAPAAVADTGGVSATAYVLLCGVVFVELLIVAVLLYMLGVFSKAAVAAEVRLQKMPPHVSLWDKMNIFKPLHEEISIDPGHNYGRKRNYRLRPLWVYGFYCTIIVAGVYLYMQYASNTQSSDMREHQIAAAKAKAAFLKKAANNIDETTVRMLSEDTSLAAGKTIFKTNCFACHGMLGEGGVGPNLTDDYWLHGGTLSDVFKTIKYGWPDKGMKSWKDDFSPMQLEQVASYVKSLHGTNPPNGKAPQGTLVVEEKSVSLLTAKPNNTGRDENKQ